MMGMSTHVVGFRPPDEKWRQMKAVWDACGIAQTEVPDEVAAFFGYQQPDDAGIEVEIVSNEYSSDDQEGHEIKLSDLPDNIDRIRFYNSW